MTEPAPLPSPMAPQFLRYAGAGAIGTALHYAMLIGLVQLARIDAVVASTAGAIAGAIVNYVLNHRFTFASDRAAPAGAAALCADRRRGHRAQRAGDGRRACASPARTTSSRRSSRRAAVLVAGYLANRAWTF